MNPGQISSATAEQLVGVYRENARVHSLATEQGDHSAANKAADVIAAIYAELRHRGKSAQVELLHLLDEPEPGVRLWAAAHALEFSPKDGEEALAQLSSANGLTAFNARVTLKEWRAGRLRFP